jgi:hypothetical protein
MQVSKNFLLLFVAHVKDAYLNNQKPTGDHNDIDGRQKDTTVCNINPAVEI